ncbi:MAG: allantoate amidohydrolase [Gammaproteobacteria bacterium]|nr:allantoate amidohydrolase [Gammaproteobacteria bacterium]
MNKIKNSTDSTLGARILERVESLAEFSESPSQLTRQYLSEEHHQANGRVAAWMRDAGMKVRVDAVGNIIGRLEADDPDAPCLMLGSHLDTVRNAGRYDGTLGVVLPICCIDALRERGQKPSCHIEIIGFGDEEGVRFGQTLIGSRAVTGELHTSVLSATDETQTTMADALRAFGLDPETIHEAARDPGEVTAYLEVHIEQGPVLEAESLPVGVVTAIAGASRFAVTVTGVAGHAGTVPMDLRRDALTAAARMVSHIADSARADDHIVATIGKFAVPDGAVNVIPGQVEFSLDVRSGDDDARAGFLQQSLKRLREIAAEEAVAVQIEPLHDNNASQCDGQLSAQLTAAIEHQGVSVRQLPSGAGHDAMAIAAIAPTAMLFVRCKGGISHHPAESMTAADAQVAGDVVMQFMLDFSPPVSTHALQEAKRDVSI